jgi:di/tripeptidase
MTFVAELEPHALWKHFDDLLTIPRPSKHEEKARAYVIDVAERKGLRHREDAIGNVVVLQPASPGKESAPAVVLQAHLDMVTEKNAGTVHDFFKDPILPRRDGDWVKATGTTLGADNGIGAATILAVLDSDDLVHGPLELLFTVDEETGLTGALDLDPVALDLKGRLLLNLDSEEEDTVTVGCAGGSTSLLTMPVENAPAPHGTVSLDVKLSGLKGGHSGMEIHLQRGNASKLLARVLFAAVQQTPFHLASGGGAHCEPRRFPGRRRAGDCRHRRRDPLRRSGREARDPGVASSQPRLDRRRQPPGDRSPERPPPRRPDDELRHPQSGGDEHQSCDRHQHRGFHRHPDEHPQLLGLRHALDQAPPTLDRRARRCRGRGDRGLPRLETGPHLSPPRPLPAGAPLREKFPEMLAISFGPIIRGAHSPDEGVKIDSVGRFWELLKATLAELAA